MTQPQKQIKESPDAWAAASLRVMLERLKRATLVQYRLLAYDHPDTAPGFADMAAELLAWRPR